MDNNNIPTPPPYDPEIEELRRQYAGLKEMTEKERLISEKLLKKVVSTRLTDIRSTLRNMCILGVIGTILWVLICVWFDFSLAFLIGTEVLLIADLLNDLRMAHNLKPRDLADRSLLEISRHTVRAARQFRYSFVIGVIAVILWMIWFIFEVSDVEGPNKYIDYGLNFGAIAGCIVGVGVTIYIFRKISRQFSTADTEIREYLSE